jgi:hypothetical protein
MKEGAGRWCARQVVAMPIINTSPENFNWRTVEIAAVDAFRRQGCQLRYRNGVTHLIVEFHDDDTGELLRQRHILDVEKFARDLAGALP